METSNMEKRLREAFAAKGWTAQVIEEGQANLMTGDIDVFVEDEEQADSEETSTPTESDKPRAIR